ncbi:MAG TPA: HNH endonuclease [Anaeromyxobacteraceae bacterium]|nr:HNH endonuclease [Anaeromyxobacteraceae bacterium]
MSGNPDYMAGADGRIYTRLRHRGFGRWKYVDWHPATSRRRQRSRTVIVEQDDKKVSVTLARIICIAFHGPPPCEPSCVLHLDGDQDNNRAENLAWGIGTELAAVGHHRGSDEQHPAHRLTSEERAHLRWAVGVGLCSQRQASRMLGIALSTVQGILHASASDAHSRGACARDAAEGPVRSISGGVAGGDPAIAGDRPGATGIGGLAR